MLWINTIRFIYVYIYLYKNEDVCVCLCVLFFDTIYSLCVKYFLDNVYDRLVVRQWTRVDESGNIRIERRHVNNVPVYVETERWIESA